jgi:hypothetical protein
MKDLIRAFQIFGRYTNSDYPTSCEHDVMYVYVEPSRVSLKDMDELQELGFESDNDLECFVSTKFGSC